MLVPLHRLSPLMLGAALAIGGACHESQARQEATLSSAGIDFGEVPRGTPAVSLEVELRAPTDAGLEIASISLPAPFEHDLSPAPLAAGERRRFTVSLGTERTGVHAGTLTISFVGNHPSLGLPVGGHVLCQPFAEPVFDRSSLLGADELENPTSLQFGPDRRLYVAQEDGLIRAYRVQRVGPSQYQVISSETIDLIQKLPNHRDDGSPDHSVNTRLVTGLLVDGVESAPVLYVTSCDPRVHISVAQDLDTNSGVLSRLTWDGLQWDHVDLVRGLPRSREAHVSNGMAIDPLTQTLYLAQGGHTNKGAPSTVLGGLPEYAYSAAILAVDLGLIGDHTYDLPTLDDEDRPGDPDANDPFGGNSGKNQARFEVGGPVQVHSPGWRNPYDVVYTRNLRLYAFDNGPNAGWGHLPISCSNALNDTDTETRQDQLHLVTGPGYYAGHANPTRGSTANTFNASAPQSPVLADNPIECQWLDPNLPLGSGGDGALVTLPFSTGGITEYTTGNFGGALEENLLVTSLDRTVWRIELSSDGATVLEAEPLFADVGLSPLDVQALPSTDDFPGTIWVADYGSNRVIVYEPLDYDDPCGPTCTGVNLWGIDEDDDGYANADEILNGTDPCSSGDFPPDADGDLLSDLVDPDDDNDGADDALDFFAVDALDGLGTQPRLSYSWFGNDPGHGLLGLGFTGLMSDGVTDYLDLFEPDELTAGGAVGVLTIDDVPLGSAVGSANDQRSAFQFGVAVDAATGRYFAQTRLLGPYFGGQVPVGTQTQGMMAGTGGQDDFLRFVLAAGDPLGALEVGFEDAGVYQSNVYAVDLLTADFLDLRLFVDPLSATVLPRISIEGGPFQNVGPALTLPAGSALEAAFFGPPALAVGVIANTDPGLVFSATWDDFQVQLGGP